MTRNHVGFARAGSNPAEHVLHFFVYLVFWLDLSFTWEVIGKEWFRVLGSFKVVTSLIFFRFSMSSLPLAAKSKNTISDALVLLLARILCLDSSSSIVSSLRGFWLPLGNNNNRSIFYTRILRKRWYFGLVLKLVISYKVMISWRILVSITGVFFFKDYIYI